MSRKYPKRSVVRKSSRGRRGRPRRIEEQAVAQARELQLPLDVESLLELTRETLSSFAVEMGLKVAQCLLADEVTQRCGERHERVTNRTETRYRRQRGFITTAGQKVALDKPRVRSTTGRGEVELERYQLLQSPEALPQAALDDLVNGVSTRRYERVVHLARTGVGGRARRRPKPVNYLHAAARQYHKQGLPITLCRGKAPISKDWPNHVWTMRSIDAAYQLHAATNVGVVLGPRSGLVDFDCDGEAAEETFFELFDGEVIETPTWRSKRGLHRLFKWHSALEQVGKSKIVLGEGDATLEVLIGPGVQTLLPPSWSDGVQREWVAGQELSSHHVAAIPEQVLKKLGCSLDGCAVAKYTGALHFASVVVKSGEIFRRPAKTSCKEHI